MDKKLFRGVLKLIVFTVLLVFFIVQFDQVASLAKNFVKLLTPLLAGFAVAFVLSRPCAFFRRVYGKALGQKGARLVVPLAVLSAYLALIAVIVVLVAFIAPQIAQSFTLFIGSLSGYLARLRELLVELVARTDLEFLDDILAQFDVSRITGLIQSAVESAAGMITSTIPQIFSTVSGLVSGVVTGVLSLVFSVYMLAGGDTLKSQSRRVVRAYLPEVWAQRVLEVTRLTADTFTRFVSGQIIEACILACLCCVGMLFICPEYAPLISVIVGVSALIPIAGAYFGAILSALILLMVSPLRALTFLIFLVILQQLEGNIIYPRVVGNTIGLPGIWVLSAVTLGGGLFGFVGMLVGVPTASVVYTLLRRDVHRRLGKTEAEDERKA